MSLSSLVRATRKQGDQNHQIGQRKQPLIRLKTRRFRRPGDKSQMTALCEVMQVIDANASQSGYFGIGKDFLTRLYGNHGLGPLHLSATTCNPKH